MLTDIVTSPMPSALLAPVNLDEHTPRLAAEPAFKPRRFRVIEGGRTSSGYWETTKQGGLDYIDEHGVRDQSVYPTAEQLLSTNGRANWEVVELPADAVVTPSRGRRGPKRSEQGEARERHRKNTVYPLSKVVEEYCRANAVTSIHELFRTLKTVRDHSLTDPTIASSRERRMLNANVIDLMQAFSLANDRVTGRTT